MPKATTAEVAEQVLAALYRGEKRIDIAKRHGIWPGTVSKVGKRSGFAVAYSHGGSGIKEECIAAWNDLDTSIEDSARRLGVSRSVIYYHCEDLPTRHEMKRDRNKARLAHIIAESSKVAARQGTKKEAMLAAYKDLTMTLDASAKKLGVDRGTIFNAARKAGLPSRRQMMLGMGSLAEKTRERVKTNIERAAVLIGDGLTTEEIASAMGVSRATVISYARELGVDFRSRKSPPISAIVIRKVLRVVAEERGATSGTPITMPETARRMIIAEAEAQGLL